MTINIGASYGARPQAPTAPLLADFLLCIPIVFNSGRRWYQPWKWPAIWWNRGRAGDWSETAKAHVDKNDNWEQHTAHKENSDGFIREGSQRGIPGATKTRHIPGECRHPSATGWRAWTTIQLAIQDAL